MSSCSVWVLLYVVFYFTEIQHIPFENFMKLSGAGITPICSLMFNKLILNQLHVYNFKVIIKYYNKRLY